VRFQLLFSKQQTDTSEKYRVQAGDTLGKIAKKYGNKAKVIKHMGPCPEFEKYGLTMVPAVVFEGGRIMLMGVCPDMETLTACFLELGVE
jgi:hypothetical protein